MFLVHVGGSAPAIRGIAQRSGNLLHVGPPVGLCETLFSR